MVTYDLQNKMEIVKVVVVVVSGGVGVGVSGVCCCY